MNTQSRKEKTMRRQGIPVATPRVEEVIPQPRPVEEPSQPAEPITQYQDTLGDRVLYVVWLVGAGLLLFHFLGDTLLGLFF